ncbi:uncharacterized protein N7483_003848 [Penicillium malachiteum]|uniref:uncharacterized protein n=1 Tax=Penicillium malachiteum TaxID=1324776 RepID=UPI002548CFF5|nr:uncharacterized protein N7483_003848 [Penicillium malachiteum]KAJ5729340.1 hypothetical protein N7483_003848 [Penicillium malachiteum]
MTYGALTLVVFCLLPAHAYLVSPPVAPANILHCGSTPAEAKALDCRFDMFSYAWYPKPCWDKELHDEFFRAHSHETDWRMMDYTPVTAAEVLTGTYIDLRPTSGQFHDLHCTYEWRRLIRALANERPLDKKLSEFEHSYHCSHKLLQKDKTHRNETSGTTANLLFGSCGLTAEEMYRFGTKGNE